MAQLNSLLRQQVKGFVLIESVFAMIITMICFGVAMNTVNNLISSNRENNRTQARIAVNQLIAESDVNWNFSDTTWNYEAFTIHRTALNTERKSNSCTIIFEVKDRQENTLDVFQIIRALPDEN
jgi:type II secretory pathway pseudopilin PulG